MESKKAAVRSVSVWANVASIGALIGLISELRAVWDSVPPDLISDTRVWVLAFITLLGQLGGLWGRWRAVAKIGGLFRVK